MYCMPHALSPSTSFSLFEAFAPARARAHATVLGNKIHIHIHVCIAYKYYILQVFVYSKVGVALSPTLCMWSTCSKRLERVASLILFPRLNHGPSTKPLRRGAGFWVAKDPVPDKTCARVGVAPST